jgi:hypothetical protein
VSRLAVLIPLLLLVPVLVAACDGDDDDGDATPTSPAATVPAASPSPSGSPAGTPATDAAIVIESPAADAVVTVPFEVSGTANVFEGALTVDVLGDAAGLVLCERHVQASSGTGTPGTWDAALAFPPPAAESPVTLRAYSFSAEDGSMENLVERTLIVSSEHPNIVIESPSCNERVSAAGTLTVSGMAQVFEATLQVDIRDAAGTALLTQTVMAASGTEYSPWTATFDVSTLPASAFYDVVAYSFSARDGTVENEFPVPIIVEP